MLFISSSKLFWFLRYLYYYPYFFGHVGKWLHKKGKADFKIHDVTNWIPNNLKKQIYRYLKKKRQSENEIWLVDRT